MGMFDYVNAEIECPNCGRSVFGFQSKDGACIMQTVDPNCVSNFYSSCAGCKTWIEFSREPLEPATCRPTPFDRREIESLGFRMILPPAGDEK